jgi:hypothetical protein
MSYRNDCTGLVICVAGVKSGFAPTASLGPGGHVQISGHAACTEGAVADLRVTITQRGSGAVVEGTTHIRCAGDEVPWDLQAETVGRGALGPGPATACGLLQVDGVKDPPDTVQWCRDDIELIEPWAAAPRERRARVDRRPRVRPRTFRARRARTGTESRPEFARATARRNRRRWQQRCSARSAGPIAPVGCPRRSPPAATRIRDRAAPGRGRAPRGRSPPRNAQRAVRDTTRDRGERSLGHPRATGGVRRRSSRWRSSAAARPPATRPVLVAKADSLRPGTGAWYLG